MSEAPSAPPHQRCEVYYSGRVQGVGFRYTARSIAARYAVTGFVRNLHDGRVLLVVEGVRPEIDSLLADLRAEMGRCIRDEQSVTQLATREFNDFSIQH